MKEFLEKRWWGGVSVIIALILGLPALIQYFGKVNISWLAVSITLNTVLLIILALVAVWTTRLNGKYKDARGRIEKYLEMRKQLEEKGKRKRVMLSDRNEIWNLSIDNKLLSELYGQAQGLAINKFQDANLHDLDIIVTPYVSEDEDMVSIMFGFYSHWSDQVCYYLVSEIGDVNETPTPSRPAESDFDRETFRELPWISTPHWLQFVRKSCEKVAPLSPQEWTIYQISTRAHFERNHWSILFRDGLTGKESRLEWDGAGDPVIEK